MRLSQLIHAMERDDLIIINDGNKKIDCMEVYNGLYQAKAERRCGMTLENAIELIKSEYEKATDCSYVKNPLAYALYQVWKIADREVIGQIAPQTDLTDKCGSCAWAMPIKGSTKGTFGCYIECQNPNKVWRHDFSCRKQRTNPKCSLYQPIR